MDTGETIENYLRSRMSNPSHLEKHISYQYIHRSDKGSQGNFLLISQNMNLLHISINTTSISPTNLIFSKIIKPSLIIIIIFQVDSHLVIVQKLLFNHGHQRDQVREYLFDWAHFKEILGNLTG